MLRQNRVRRWLLNAAVALLVVMATLWTSAAVFAQSSRSFSLGCWAITSSGGDQRSSAQYRMRDAITPVGGEMQGSQFRIRASHLALYPVLNPTPGPGALPPQPGDVLLPVIFGDGLHLENLCR